MCTAVTYKTNFLYFGRTLDIERSYSEEVTITPRNYPFRFRCSKEIKNHYAIIGMAHVSQDYPLYYDAVNEYGLAVAGLNFVGNAVYRENMSDRDNIAQFELIPWVLSQCATIDEARKLIERTNIIGESFSNDLPAAQLHWIIADRSGAITVESVQEGIRVYENPVGVLTNNPTFPEQMFNLNNYMKLSPKEPENLFSDKIRLKAYSRGMGAMGLPGDWSSQSRFVRAAFVKLNSVSGESETDNVSQFFHILGSVEQQRGCCVTADGKYETTVYTSCCNCGKGIYYYTTYFNRQISAVDINKANLDAKILIRHPIINEQQIYYRN